MLAILIFAGKSKRFWPLSDKSLFPVCGTTLLEEQVRRLTKAGCKEILLVAGPHNLAEAKKLLPRLKTVVQKDVDVGMRGALLSALPHCKEQPVLIVSANDLIDASAFKSLIQKSKSLQKGGLLLARKVSSYFPGGYLSVTGSRITSIVEKPLQGKEPSNLVNIVAHVHTSPAELLAALKQVKPTKDDGYEIALQKLLQTHAYHAVPYEGSWQPVKYPWHLLGILEALLPSSASKPIIHKTARVHDTAVIEGPVIIGPHVKVFAHASIMGPCVIGEGTIVANNALVRGSSIGKNCVIGYNTEVARSILGNDVWTHSSYLGDSLLGNNISLGAGTTTGNLRLDEKEMVSVVQGKNVSTERTKLGAVIADNCRTGIHTCFAPGVKIGRGSLINSTTLVTCDVPENSFVTMKGIKDIDIRKNTAASTDTTTRKIFLGKLKGG
jgi:NDP-sugar pyrophosphorylase family protein